MKWIGIMIGICSLSWGAMDTAKKEGERLANTLKQRDGTVPKTPLNPDIVLPSKDKGHQFNERQATHRVLNPSRSSTVVNPTAEMRPKRPYDVHPEDPLFVQGDKVVTKPEETLKTTTTTRDVGATYEKRRCQESGKPYVLNVVRNLKVRVHYYPEQKGGVKVCLGHRAENDYWFGGIRGANQDFINHYRKAYEHHPNIQQFRTFIRKGLFNDDVGAEWVHKDNVDECQHFREETRVIQEARWEEIDDGWDAEDTEAYAKGRSPDCRCVQRHVLIGEETRVLEGRSVTRPEWKDIQIYQCDYPGVNGCDGLRRQGCKEVGQICLQSGVQGGCARWEKTFECQTKAGYTETKTQSNDGLYCVDGRCIDIASGSNERFAEVITKLSIFKELKQDLERQQATDPRTATVFGGETMRCHKNVCENLMYDCCGSLDGFTNSVGLSQCDSEEQALAQRKKAGHCHYVGSEEEHLMGVLWKSRDIHRYCCFPSKFVRVIQEQARKQLNKGWGTGKSPRCEGLTMEDISKLPFDEMDLSEAYETHLQQLKSQHTQETSLQDEAHIRRRLNERFKALNKDRRGS